MVSEGFFEGCMADRGIASGGKEQLSVHKYHSCSSFPGVESQGEKHMLTFYISIYFVSPSPLFEIFQ